MKAIHGYIYMIVASSYKSQVMPHFLKKIKSRGLNKGRMNEQKVLALLFFLV